MPTSTATLVPPASRNPRRSLRLSLVALASYPVDWACYRRDRSAGGPTGPDFVRLVRLATVDAEGREHELRLSPAEARDLGERLIDRADVMDRYNRENNNGWA